MFVGVEPFQTEKNCVATLEGELQGKCIKSICEWAGVFAEIPSVDACMSVYECVRAVYFVTVLREKLSGVV